MFNDLDNRKNFYIFTAIFGIVTLFVVGFSISMLYRAIFPEEEVVESSGESIYRDETDEEKKYSVKIYKYVPSVEEITTLKDKGYTTEEIEKLTDDELINILYGKEAMINNKYVQKHTSMYRNAKEPTKEERKQILETLIDLYKEEDYYALVTKFGVYQKEYLFEHFLDAPINALYHDAEMMVDFNSYPELTKKSKLSMRQSIYSVVYDLNTISDNLQASSDFTNCILLGKIDKIESVKLYEDISTLDTPLYYFPGTDLVYKVNYRTTENGKGVVWVGDRDGLKYLIKVVPEEKCVVVN